MKRHTKVNNLILEEILFSLSFGQATFKDFKYIFSICNTKNIYFQQILHYLQNNYDKILNDINNKITDESNRNEIISELEKLLMFKVDKIFFNYLDKWFNDSNNGEIETIQNNVDKYMNLLINKNKLNHKIIFYLLLINHLSHGKITDQDMLKQIFAKKFQEEKISLIISKGEKLAQKFNYKHDVNYFLSIKHNTETEDSELIVLFMLFLFFEECKTTENKQSILKKYFKYFSEFDLSKSIYSTFNQVCSLYFEQKTMKIEYYYDFLIQIINKSNDLTVSNNESQCIILTNFINCIIKINENANLSKLNLEKFALYLKDVISSPEIEKNENTLINLFRALMTINHKYKKLIWKTCKNMFQKLLNSSITNEKLLFTLTFFIKYYKINQKKESLKYISDRLSMINENNIKIEVLLILIYASQIRCKIKQGTFIYNWLNIIKDSKQNIQKLNEELKEYNKYKDFPLMINGCNVDTSKTLMSQGKYTDKKGEIQLDPSAYLNRVEIKISDLSKALDLIYKYKGFKKVDGNYQLLGIVILYTKYGFLETKTKHVFLYNKYNQFWYYCNNKEFILDISINTYSENLTNIVLYFFLIENNFTKIQTVWETFNHIENVRTFLPWEIKENIIWLEANDIKLSYEFLLNYFKCDFESFEKLCQFIIESRYEPKIKSEEEKNALKFIISFFKEHKKIESNWTKKILKLVNNYK